MELSNKERVKNLVTDFADKLEFDTPMEGCFKLWEEINEDTPTVSELLELGYIGLFISTLDACMAVCSLEWDMINICGSDKDETHEHASYRTEPLDLRLRELLVEILKERLNK